MLLEFQTKNYKSFKDTLVFSMIPAPKQKDLEYSILRKKIMGTEHKALSSAVIYGPNASGKTNIIGAMDTFKAIVLRGNIKNDKDVKTPNVAANLLELVPNNMDVENHPVEFHIKFIENNLLISYGMVLDLGTFLDKDYDRKIICESLEVNDELIFKRDTELQLGENTVIKKYMKDVVFDNLLSAKTLSESNLNEKELFLTNGFKTIFSSELAEVIMEWVKNKFVIIYRADAISLVSPISNGEENAIYLEETLTKAAECFGITSNGLGYVKNDDEHKTKLYSYVENKNEKVAIPIDMFESYGTVRFVNLFPLIVSAMKKGATLVIDEFDASIHPMALMNLVNIFHNDDVNIKNAQLIFNTHNPIFLNSNLFRRDEIKFVERDEKTHYSTHYSLSDFKTSGKYGVRKGEDYMKKYFISQYGAINDIDFTPVFENVLGIGEGEQYGNEKNN